MIVEDLIAILIEMPEDAEVFFDGCVDRDPCVTIHNVEFNSRVEKYATDGQNTWLPETGVFLS